MREGPYDIIAVAEGIVDASIISLEKSSVVFDDVDLGLISDNVELDDDDDVVVDVVVDYDDDVDEDDDCDVDDG
jgi:hypothetical protein